MVAQTAEWVGEQDQFAERCSSAERVGGQQVFDQEISRAKLGAAKGVGLGVLAGAACWGLIIFAVIQFR